GDSRLAFSSHAADAAGAALLWGWLVTQVMVHVVTKGFFRRPEPHMCYTGRWTLLVRPVVLAGGGTAPAGRSPSLWHHQSSRLQRSPWAPEDVNRATQLSLSQIDFHRRRSLA